MCPQVTHSGILSNLCYALYKLDGRKRRAKLKHKMKAAENTFQAETPVMSLNILIVTWQGSHQCGVALGSASSLKEEAI